MNTRVLNSCVRIPLIISNILFFIFAVYLLTVGVRAINKSKNELGDQDLFKEFSKNFDLVAITMLVLGCVMVIVSVIGFIAGWIANQIALVIYEIGLIILFILHIFNLIIYTKFINQYSEFVFESSEILSTIISIISAIFLALELIYIIGLPLLMLRFKRRGNQVLL